MRVGGISGSGSTINQVMTKGTAVQIAAQEKISKEAEAAKAREITRVTRTSAETFASAFEYLFTRITTLLDKLGGYWGANSGKGIDWTTFDAKATQQDINDAKISAITMASSSVDTDKLSQSDKRTLESITRQIDKGFKGKGGEKSQLEIDRALEFLRRVPTKNPQIPLDLDRVAGFTTDTPSSVVREAAESANDGANGDAAKLLAHGPVAGSPAPDMTKLFADTNKEEQTKIARDFMAKMGNLGTNSDSTPACNPVTAAINAWIQGKPLAVVPSGDTKGKIITYNSVNNTFNLSTSRVEASKRSEVKEGITPAPEVRVQ